MENVLTWSAALLSTSTELMLYVGESGLKTQLLDDNEVASEEYRSFVNFDNQCNH